jgi:hypothetical protein
MPFIIKAICVWNLTICFNPENHHREKMVKI